MHKRFKKPTLIDLLTYTPPVFNFSNDPHNSLIIHTPVTIGTNNYILRIAAYKIKFIGAAASGVILDGTFDYDSSNSKLQYTIYADKFKLIAYLLHALSIFITKSNKKLITPIDAVSFGATKSYNGINLAKCNLFERMYDMTLSYYRETAYPIPIYSYDINMPNHKGIDYIGKMHVMVNTLSQSMITDIKNSNLDLILI